ncbi:choline sulfatase [Rhodopirellula sallentina SM41]|uniref:Choline sulfatase n=2 Tax=Rhodopirellula TaxID=265488 RepID=M5UBQ7_9BACT|nr:choline sulfatase [Rhodopirellula sallentina SM41]
MQLPSSSDPIAEDETMSNAEPTLHLNGNRARMSVPLIRAFLVCLIGWSVSQTCFADDETKPNILFLFADDLAYNCVANGGNDEVITPNLDELARRGTSFTHCYNMGGWNGAVCQASRAMLNTGRFLWNAHALEGSIRKTEVPEKRLWAQRLESAGYDTYFTGKWHVSASADSVFGTARNVRGGMPNQTPQGYNRPRSPEDKVWQPWDKKFGGFWEGGKHWSEVVADDAELFFDSASQSDNPFFMYIAFNAAHDPRQAPKEFVDMYPFEEIEVPQPFYKEYPYPIGSNRCRDEKLAPFPRTKYSVQINRQEYYAIITHMDREIGRVLKALEDSGKADNTYIFFTADHGLAAGHHGLMGKQNMHHHSMRVPFTVVGPDVPESKKIDSNIYLQDVVPTTFEIAKMEKPDEVDFKSVLPLINGARERSYESIYGAYIDFQRMIVDGDYKLIVYPKIDKKQLFNLADDPLEENDLINDPDQSERIAMLTEKLKALQKEMNDPLAQQ